MADRKPTPNIMNELLGEDPVASEPKGRGGQTKLKASKPVKQQDSIPLRQPTRVALKPIKATYYLSLGTLEAIDEAWLQLRKMAKPEGRSGISKSMIVEKAIQIALQEFEDKGEKSPLASMTVNQ